MLLSKVVTGIDNGQVAIDTCIDIDRCIDIDIDICRYYI